MIMQVVPFVREGLGNSSYLVQVGESEAVLIDPDRSVDRYLRSARERGWKIGAVLETHLHADFVSGALEVGYLTNAHLYASGAAELQFPHKPLKAGQRILIGDVRVEVISSPGHTPEHLSYSLRGDRQPPVLFSGGALIVGGAARTDLISPEMTETLTRATYRTLREAFSELPDETLLYPTHGRGSFCSTGAGGRRASTLGAERAENPLMSIRDEEEFVSWFPSTFPSGIPDYFFRMRSINQAGPRLRSRFAAPPPLSPDQFDAAREAALVIDVRPYEDYAIAHVPGAISNTFRDVYATFLGWVVPPDKPLLFVLGDVLLDRVVDESLLVGYERFAGWLDGDMNSWMARGLPVSQVRLATANEARVSILNGAVALDVREDGEFASGHIEGAVHVPLGRLEARLEEIPRDKLIIAYCGHGERSSTALSILERAGAGDLVNLSGGMGAWRDSGYEAVEC